MAENLIRIGVAKERFLHLPLTLMKLLIRYANKLQRAYCGFAQSIPRMPVVFMNTARHAVNRLCCASLALFVTYLHSGLVV